MNGSSSGSASGQSRPTDGGSGQNENSSTRPDLSTTASRNLYDILNVRPEATASELKAAYRQLSQRYHPDKHSTESEKVAATDKFTQVKEAYEILSSEKLQRLYNEFGLAAARSAASPELELVPYSELAQRFRSDSWNEKNGSGRGNDAGKDAYFTVSNSIEPRVDATGLLVAMEDGLEGLSGSVPLGVVSQVGIMSNATAYLTQHDTLSCRYSLAGHGRATRIRSDPGVGDVELSWRHQIDNYTYLDSSVQTSVDAITADEPNVSVKAFRSLSNDMSMSCESSMRGVGKDLTTALSAARSFNDRCSASVSWAIGARGGYAFTWVRNAYDEYVAESKDDDHDEYGNPLDDDDGGDNDDAVEETQLDTQQHRNRRRVELRPFYFIKRMTWYMRRFLEPVGLRWTARMNGADVALSFVARRPIGENAPLWGKCQATGPGGIHTKLSGVIGLVGWEMKAGLGRRFMMADTEVGTSIGMGTAGIIWRVKARRGAHKLSIPIILQSGFLDTRSAIMASLLWSAVTSAVELAIVGPWRGRIEARERADAREARKDELQRAKEEAEASVSSMQLEVSRKRETENNVPIDSAVPNSKGGGLLIERAIYGWKRNVVTTRFSDGLVVGKELEMEMTEVTDAVQVLVDRSAVQIVSRTKCTLAGFWDPTALGEKEEVELKIWYRFRGNPHECTVQDGQPIELPLSSHRVTKWH